MNRRLRLRRWIEENLHDAAEMIVLALAGLVVVLVLVLQLAVELLGSVGDRER